MATPAKKAAKLKPDFSNLKEVRNSRGENQMTFWSRFGVTQSGGSRYESGRDVPMPAAMLLMLYLNGVIDDAALAKVKKALTK